MRRALALGSTALMADGSGVQFERMAYEHPAAQAVHESIYDAAFVQGGLGRGRGINRAAATPLTIYVYGNCPLPVPLASLARWQPDRERKLLAQDGTHSNAGDLARFTDEFPTEAAAARWRARVPFDETKLRLALADDARAFVRITWQPRGQGHKPRCSIIPGSEAGRFRRRVERAFSGLTQWQVEAFTAGMTEDQDTDRIGTYPVLSWSSWEQAPRRGGSHGSGIEIPEHPPDG